MTTLVTRSQWGARAPRPGIASLSPTFGVTVHYEGGSGLNITDHAQCASIVRGIQRYHMDAKGWLDIAYTALGCPHDYVFQGRWTSKRTAAQGTDAGNSVAYALCALLDTDDPLAPGLLDSLVGGIKMLRHPGAGTGVNGHRDWHATACPRDDLYATIPELRRRADAPPAPAPVPDLEDPMIVMPSYAKVQANGRVAFVEIRPIDNDTFHAVLHNNAVGCGVKLERKDGTTPSGLPYMEVQPTTGAALGATEHQGLVRVGCVNSGTYAVARPE